MDVHPETDDPLYWATVYRMAAVNFRMSAEKLLPTIRLRDDGTPEKLTAVPFYFLISHVIELLLKCALLKRGNSLSDLRRFNSRHNLAGLLALVVGKDLPVSVESREIIVGFSEQHQQHLLRYHVLINPFMPPPANLWPMLDELLLLTRISTFGK
jgi:hypothetical protein